VIVLAARWYLRFGLSFRVVEELLELRQAGSGEEDVAANAHSYRAGALDTLALFGKSAAAAHVPVVDLAGAVERGPDHYNSHRPHRALQQDPPPLAAHIHPDVTR
jgi:hypothetical protein